MVHADVPSVKQPPDIHVEVAVGVAPRDVRLVRLSLPAGSTVREALRASGLFTQVPGLNEEALAAGIWSVGVWGRKERPGHALRERDRDIAGQEADHGREQHEAQVVLDGQASQDTQHEGSPGGSNVAPLSRRTLKNE